MDIESLNFKIKADRSLPHHYIVGVEVTNAQSSNPGRFRLKYGPVYYQHKDIEKIENCILRIKDELFRQSREDALRAEGLYEIAEQLAMMQLSCHANGCTIHHFSSAFQLEDEDIVTFIEAANVSKDIRRKLDGSRVDKPIQREV